MPKRWAIRVTFASGEDAYLRHGSRIGYGPVATFSSRKLAEINADFVGQGLEAGAVVSIVPHLKSASAGAAQETTTEASKGATSNG